MQVRLSFAPKHVTFVYKPDEQRIRATFIKDDQEVSWKWLTADEENCITDVHEGIYDHSSYSVAIKELLETDFMFDDVDGDRCNFEIMLDELSNK